MQSRSNSPYHLAILLTDTIDEIIVISLVYLKVIRLSSLSRICFL